MEGQDFSGKQAQRLNLAGVVRDRAEAMQRLRSYHVSFKAQARRVDIAPLAMKPIEEQLQDALARVQTLETDAQASVTLLSEASASAETFKTQLTALTTERDQFGTDLTAARQSIETLTARNKELETKEQDIEQRVSFRLAQLAAATGTKVPAKISPAGDTELATAASATAEERIAHYNELVKSKKPKEAAEYYQKNIQSLFNR
jgi:chromosome segregation ATPase